MASYNEYALSLRKSSGIHLRSETFPGCEVTRKSAKSETSDMTLRKNSTSAKAVNDYVRSADTIHGIMGNLNAENPGKHAGLRPQLHQPLKAKLPPFRKYTERNTNNSPVCGRKSCCQPSDPYAKLDTTYS